MRGRGRGRSSSASLTRQMPPWHIDQSVGVRKFKNDMSLSDEQIDTIARWVDAGAPEGNPKDLPPRQAAAHRQRVAGGERRPRSAGSDRQVVRVHDAGQAPGCLVPADERSAAHRAAVGEDGRDPADESEGPEGPAPCDRLSRAEQRSGSGEHGHGEHRRRRRPRRRQPGRSPPAADGVGDRQRATTCSARAPASCSCPAKRSRGISTSTRPAKRSPPEPRSASGCIRKARSRRSAAT